MKTPQCGGHVSHSQSYCSTSQSNTIPLSQVQIQSIKSQIEDAEGVLGRPSNTALDRAIQGLTAMSNNGQLSGVFYGRLQDVAHVTDKRAMLAVNAVLKEQCNPVRTCLLQPHPW